MFSLFVFFGKGFHLALSAAFVDEFQADVFKLLSVVCCEVRFQALYADGFYEFIVGRLVDAIEDTIHRTAGRVLSKARLKRDLQIVCILAAALHCPNCVTLT